MSGKDSAGDVDEMGHGAHTLYPEDRADDDPEGDRPPHKSNAEQILVVLHDAVLLYAKKVHVRRTCTYETRSGCDAAT